MGTPAAILGDSITGACAIHQIPGPQGGPIPSPPVPFRAPLLQGLATRTLIAGKPAAVAGSLGYSTPPHVGLHPADPFATPPTQIGTVTAGSPTVLVEGRPAARTGAPSTMCGGAPGSLIGSAATVLIGP